MANSSCQDETDTFIFVRRGIFAVLELWTWLIRWYKLLIKSSTILPKTNIITVNQKEKGGGGGGGGGGQNKSEENM